MRPGPKPQPEAMKAQRAAVRSRRSRTRVPQEAVPTSPTTPPTWLKGAALAIWKRLASTLTQAKLLTLADRETFARYCRNFARWLDMNEALDKEGEIYTVTTESGTVHRPRPEFLIADRLERQLLAAEDRFGLNPAERQRIFAARSQTGVSGDLFDAPTKPPPGGRSADEPAAQAAAPAAPVESPIGTLQ